MAPNPAKPAARAVVLGLLEFDVGFRAAHLRIAAAMREGRIAAQLSEEAGEGIALTYARAEATFAHAVHDARVRFSPDVAVPRGMRRALGTLGAAESAAQTAAKTVMRDAADLLIRRASSQMIYSRPIMETLGPEGVERIFAFMNTYERPLARESERYLAVLKGAVTQAYAQRTQQGIAAAHELLERANDARLLLPQADRWVVHHEIGEVFGPAFADRARAARQLELTSRYTVKGADRGLHLSPIKDEPLQWFDESVWLVYPHADDLISIFTGGLEYKGLANAVELAAQFPTGIERLGLGRVRLSIGDARTLLLPALIRPKMFGAFPTGATHLAPNLPRIGARVGLPIDPIPLGDVNSKLWGISRWLGKEWGKPPAQSLIPILKGAGR